MAKFSDLNVVAKVYLLNTTKTQIRAYRVDWPKEITGPADLHKLAEALHEKEPFAQHIDVLSWQRWEGPLEL